MKGTLGCLALAAVLAGCVEETDASLQPSAEPAPAPSAEAVQAPASTRLVASITEWAVALSSVEAAAGTISLDVENNGAEPHALEIRGGGEEWLTDTIQPGETITMSVALPPGTYDVYCPLASGGESHADRGMRTTLRVR
jgi:plastocyanin